MLRESRNTADKLSSVTCSISTSLCYLTGLFCLALCGCNTFGNTKLVQELKHENERLLAEYRAERDRRVEAERARQLVENRLAESEKLLARQFGNTPLTGRLSSLPRADLSNQVISGQSAIDISSGLSGIPQSYSDSSGLRWQKRSP